MIAIPDLHWNPWILNPIKNVEDTIVFLTRKVFLSDNFAIASSKQKMPKLLSQRTRKWK